MISLTRFNGATFWLNAELVETVEATPDVVISLVNGRKYVVRESVQEVISAIIDYRSNILFRPKEEEKREF